MLIISAAFKHFFITICIIYDYIYVLLKTGNMGFLMQIIRII